jgi:hypothetical protein
MVRRQSLRSSIPALVGTTPSNQALTPTAGQLLKLAGDYQTAGEPVREFPCRLQVVVLDVGRRDFDPEKALAVFA